MAGLPQKGGILVGDECGKVREGEAVGGVAQSGEVAEVAYVLEF